MSSRSLSLRRWHPPFSGYKSASRLGLNPMIVGLLSIELHLAGAHSLKDKRAVLRRLKDRFAKLNVGVAEVAHQGLQQRARLGVVAIGSDRNVAERTLERVVSEIERVEPGVLLRSDVEWLT